MPGNYHVRFVVLRHNHHSPHSGYSRVAEYGMLQYNSKSIKVNPLPRSIVRNRLMWWMANGVKAYDRTSMAAEIKTAWHMFREQKCIYHLLYGENTYHYLGFLNNFRQNRLVATFHQPPTIIPEGVQIDWHIRQLSGVVCVGRNQKSFFEKLLAPERIFFVPLGVDTEYFVPPAPSKHRDPNLCLFVGDHLRDFPTLRGVIELVAFQRPETKFVVLTRPHRFELIGTHPNLTLLSGISEPEMLKLYQTASLLVIPLKDATANNAILEGLACGLPIVVTDVGATVDYVNSECAVLTKLQDSRGMADEILGLLDSPRQRQIMAQQAREHALTFSWPKVVGQLQTVYETVI